ncbi:protein of unknown function [Candidatus Nitrosacidococcus tergens]|uniref:Uncharacterized protein n=1 Tax=Candidatus Nitrosacidococcus tergens TaxID=553981 RepID=A0A7G1Q9L4_9GAMM|nr:protein of unknown function [Candidatus Nitrosacidococcus tergens]
MYLETYIEKFYDLQITILYHTTLILQGSKYFRSLQPLIHYKNYMIKFKDAKI